MLFPLLFETVPVGLSENKILLRFLEDSPLFGYLKTRSRIFPANLYCKLFHWRKIKKVLYILQKEPLHIRILLPFSEILLHTFDYLFEVLPQCLFPFFWLLKFHTVLLRKKEHSLHILVFRLLFYKAILQSPYFFLFVVTFYAIYN